MPVVRQDGHILAIDFAVAVEVNDGLDGDLRGATTMMKMKGRSIRGDLGLDRPIPGVYLRTEVERWTRKHPLGSTVPVHYKPSYPASSVIEPTGGPGPLGLCVGILAVVAGVVMRRMGKRPKPAGQTVARRPVAEPSSPPREL